MSQISEVPLHIGFIMDGNRRWAQNRGLDPIEGHRKGQEALETVIESAAKRGIKNVTVFAFSTENWSRTEREVSALMALFSKAIKENARKLTEKGVRIKFIGRISDFPVKLKEEMAEIERVTTSGENITVHIAISYGGRAEIVDAVRKIIGKGIKAEEVTEDTISENIYEKDVPDPELIVRTGGMPRLSGFMLWQASYSEIYFTNTLWPDFNEVELDKALDFYRDIKRNFGK